MTPPPAPATPERVRDALVAAENGDLDALRGVLDRAVTWHTPIHNLTGGDHLGAEQSLELLREYRRLSANTLRVEARDIRTRDGQPSVRLHATASRQGHGMLDIEEDITFRIEDGKVIEMWTRPRDNAAWDRFWSP